MNDVGRVEQDRTVELSWEGAEGPVLLRIETEHDGRIEALSPGDARVLGASRACDVRVDDRTVSARHCRVRHVGAAVEVVDLGSKNGIWIGGARVSAATVGVGAAFSLGRATVHVDPVAPAGAPDEDALPLRGLVGRSRPMRRLASAVRRVAPLRLPVLLRGESGTGKDLVARAIHEESRRSGSFVVINAATVSRELAESELFGHRRGAFTGAMRDRRGAFREAHQGTLFLDEIAALPLEVQAKLLRAVEEGRVRPLGGEEPAEIDVRLVAATCEPLEEMVARGSFRADLYERLAVCLVPVPPLRERLEDVPALARHLLATSELGDKALSPGAVAALRAHRFPGNVRELRNVLVQAAVRAGPVIDAADVRAVLADRTGTARRVPPALALRFLEETGGNVSAAARRAALPRSTLRDLVRAAQKADRLRGAT